MTFSFSRLAPLSVAVSLVSAPLAARAETAAPAPAAPATAPAAAPSVVAAPAPALVDKAALLPAPAPAAAPAATVAGVDVRVGGDRPTNTGEIGGKPGEVFADDWWSHTRPTVELHGYYRVRAELFHNFALGRVDKPDSALWPQPPDNAYTPRQGSPQDVKLCGSDAANLQPCSDKTQAGANMRFRINPEIHVSDNLRIVSQIDMLDNLVLGSTPDGYANQPGTTGGYQTYSRGGYVPLGVFNTTQVPPTAGVNSLGNSVAVKRVWGEYMTPVGQLRFGRMPSHWGLGMLANSGDGHDSDWQSTSDRIMFMTGIKSLDLYFAAAWDFVNEGASSANHTSLGGGQPYDLAQLDDVNQYVLVVVRKRNAELQKLELARGEAVVNGGVYFVYRDQLLANDVNGGGNGAPSLGASTSQVSQGYVRRNAKAYIPDGWLQVLYKKFRFEAEAVMLTGSVDNLDSTQGAGAGNYKNTGDPANNGWKIRQYGVATQTEFKAVEDKLKLQFGFGWASGDPDLGPDIGGAGSLAPSRTGSGVQPQLTRNRTYSEFGFHPDYRVDLILFRNIMTRVQGSYYFRPSVDYDFSRSQNGQRFGGGAAIIWSRASEFVQTPGHHRDLGLELDLSLYFQSKDGSLNDNPDKMGGFFTALQYGVLFPLGGLGYLPGETSAAAASGIGLDTSAAQILRWYMGVLY